jgi:hypothetical protein
LQGVRVVVRVAVEQAVIGHPQEHQAAVHPQNQY